MKKIAIIGAGSAIFSLNLIKDITFKCVGVNHFVWLTKLYHKGEDAMPLLKEWVETKSETYFKTSNISDGNGPKAVDLYRRYGVFPIGDTCTPGGGSWFRGFPRTLRWKCRHSSAKRACRASTPTDCPKAS